MTVFIYFYPLGVAHASQIIELKHLLFFSTLLLVAAYFLWLIVLGVIVPHYLLSIMPLVSLQSFMIPGSGGRRTQIFTQVKVSYVKN